MLRIPIHCGSIRVTAARQGKEAAAPVVATMLAAEQKWDARRFGEKSRNRRDTLRKLVEGLVGAGRTVVGYGASGRCTILLNYCGLGLEGPNKLGVRPVAAARGQGGAGGADSHSVAPGVSRPPARLRHSDCVELRGRGGGRRAEVPHGRRALRRSSARESDWPERSDLSQRWTTMERILVTGGNGFLGKRLGKRLRELGHEVVLAGRNNKQNFLATEFSGCKNIAMDVASIESVRDIFTQIQPTVVVHAAATKFVDISERQPMETIDVNVLGSQNVARVAIDKGVKLVIGVSTDKASPPVRNSYGLTKALMERMFCSMDEARAKPASSACGTATWHGRPRRCSPCGAKISSAAA